MKRPFTTEFMGEIKESHPFADEAAQNLFREWCRINDSIVPEFVSREKFLKKKNEDEILKMNLDGKQTLFIPEDLHLWEMKEIVGIVDHDTHARRPERRTQGVERINELGEMFEKAGLYLAEYLPELKEDEGASIARDMSRIFYEHGLSLSHERQFDEAPQEGLKSLSTEDKEKLDRWLLGEKVYQNRIKKLGDHPTEAQKEDLRKTLIRVYFKALAREGSEKAGEKPWEIIKGPAQHLQDETRKGLAKAMLEPEHEMYSAMFSRGLEKLVTEMMEPDWKEATEEFLTEIGFNPLIEKRRLYDALNIPNLKKELDEVRESGDVEAISAKELKIAKKIQKAVGHFTYQKYANNPSEMIQGEFINCVGASMLGGVLLDELKIKYLHAELPGHSLTILITSDGRAYWQDFTPREKTDTNYVEIKSDMITPAIEIGKTDIFNGLSIKFNDWHYENGNRVKINLMKPEAGLKYHVLDSAATALGKIGKLQEAEKAGQLTIAISLQSGRAIHSNLGHTLADLGKNEEAVEAYREAIRIDSEHIHAYNNLGNALSNLGRNEEAVEAYREAIRIDPKYANAYHNLGYVLKGLGRNEEAVEAYREAIRIDPESTDTYFNLGNILTQLGRGNEAIESYKKYISLYKGKDNYKIKRVKKIIRNLEQQISKENLVANSRTLGDRILHWLGIR